MMSKRKRSVFVWRGCFPSIYGTQMGPRESGQTEGAGMEPLCMSVETFLAIPNSAAAYSHIIYASPTTESLKKACPRLRDPSHV